MQTVKEIQQKLYQSLAQIGNIQECALLDYPDYPNIGDHLIWLGTLFYFYNINKTQIQYTASIQSFKDDIMTKNISDHAVILLQGGGNLGDLWSDNQLFREYIISKYKHRKIIILPQSIYFADENNLKKTANIFNSHPDLTIFVRDNYSYQIATNNFHQCQVFLSPDMAFSLADIPDIAVPPIMKYSPHPPTPSPVGEGEKCLPHKECNRYIKFNKYQKNKILFLNRIDKENNKEIDLNLLKIDNLVIEDWISYQWIHRENINSESSWYWKIPGSVKIYREVWQKGLKHPLEWISRQIWQNFHPSSAILKNIHNPSLHQKSWQLFHSGLWQFNGYNLIITNRLHGHILCLLLDIPHIFLPNSYYKNEQFYETWTKDIAFCQFVNDINQIKNIIEILQKGD